MTAMPGGACTRTNAPPGASVVLVCYQDQGNLGMGYVAAVLQQHGHSVELIDPREPPDVVLRRIVASRPLVVGFSLIFQSFLHEFHDLARYLRAAGVRCHFTIGGHYPSLCPRDVLEQVPELDSIARYEGEFTLLELVERLETGRDWRDVPGLVYLRNGALAQSASRPLLEDLDMLPFPHRPYEPQLILGFPTMPLLASRGCARRCSFCSIHMFYRSAEGKAVRVRDPEKVVDEMRSLYDERGVRVFLFQDDDFPVRGRPGRRWAAEFADRLRESGLVDRVVWKISCRAEYIVPELLAPLREVGLFMVYLGIESGVETGLEALHKQATVAQNLAAVRNLEMLDVGLSYGFMLFDPSSTFESVRGNIAFLRQLLADGSAAAVFCRMLPYGGTPIHEQLADEGRLRGDVTSPDYDFLDGRLNRYHGLLESAVRYWVHKDGLSHEINWAWDELTVAQRLVTGLEGVDDYDRALRRITSQSNDNLFGLVEDSSLEYEQGNQSGPDPESARQACATLHDDLLSVRNRFVASNADRIMATLSRPTSRRQ